MKSFGRLLALLIVCTLMASVMSTWLPSNFHGDLSDSLDAFLGNLTQEFQSFVDHLHDGHKDFFKFHELAPKAEGF
ncbi:hypothetical protein QBZ16_004722 [Prototheca wickerhamii]|uniref:Uncharacterized protein n=1 Tax=Prototheca wickerhamii TaxID=3111 RepID=A0AAD9MKW4_PROWI|nr:hypothetical protein QBZ16_004722 [Prototheca wickerhamii]